jgi:protein ImuB
MLWLAVHFPVLGLEVFDCSRSEAERKQLQDHATVLLEANRVVLRNRAAQQAGIERGTTLATAHSIAPSIRHFNREPERENRRLKLLAETLYRFTSQVSLHGTDCLLLEVSGSLNLFGCINKLKQQAVDLCASLTHIARVHAATTPLAALALARSGAARIEEVPLTCCELDAVLIERFANMGMYTLGPEVIDYLERLRGDLPDPREAIIPPERFESTLHLLDPITDKDALLFPMKRLLLEMHHWLVSHQLGAERLIWRFSPANSAGAVVMPVRSATPRQNQQAFLDISRLQLEQIKVPEVLSVRLSSQRLVPWHNQSTGLFDDQPQFAALVSESASGANSALADLIDHLSARLGREACQSICVNDQHAPEHAWQAVRPLQKVGEKTASQPEPSGRHASLHASFKHASLKEARPTWLFEPPRQVKERDLTLLWGPERIQTSWWDQNLHRDYYVAQHRNGARCWAFVDMSQQWYLHGYFS